MINNCSRENTKALDGFWTTVVVVMRLLLYGCAVWALIALSWAIGKGNSLIGVPFAFVVMGLYALRGATALSTLGTLERRFHKWLHLSATITGICFATIMVALWPVALPFSILAPILLGLFEGMARILEWSWKTLSGQPHLMANRQT